MFLIVAISHKRFLQSTLTMSVNMKFACLGRSPTIEEVYEKCEKRNLPVWDIGDA